MKFYVTKEFIKKIRESIKNNNYIFTDEGNLDLVKHSIPKSLVVDAFMNGMIIEDIDLYSENPDLKHRGKKYYCLFKYRENLFSLRTILISFILKDNVAIFHVSNINFMSREERYYRRNIKEFKELFP